MLKLPSIMTNYKCYDHHRVNSVSYQNYGKWLALVWGFRSILLLSSIRTTPSSFMKSLNQLASGLYKLIQSPGEISLWIFTIHTTFVAYFFLSKNDCKHSMQPEFSRSLYLTYLPVSENLRMPVDYIQSVVAFILEIKWWGFLDKNLIKCNFVQEYFEKLLKTRMH